MSPRSLRARTTLLLECLEPRTLLSAVPFAKAGKGGKGSKGGTNFDFAPTAISLPAFKTPAISGQADKGTISVTINNTGTDTSSNATVSVFLRPTSGSDINITQASGKIKKLAPNSPKSANVKITLPSTIPAGTYTLVAVVNGADINPADNTFVAPLSFTLDAGTLAVIPSLSNAKFPTSFAAGTNASGSISLSFSNSGTVSLPAGSATVSVSLHPSTGTDIPIITNASINLPALKLNAHSKPIAFPISGLSILPAGTYTLLVTITPAGLSSSTPISLTGPTFTVTGGSVTPPTTGILQHGDTLHFDANTQLTGSNFQEMGSFSISGSKITGSYNYTPGTLSLTYSDGSSELIDVLPLSTDVVTFLDPTLDGNPTTVTFTTDPTGAFAESFGLGADGTTTAYLHHA